MWWHAQARPGPRWRWNARHQILVVRRYPRVNAHAPTHPRTYSPRTNLLQASDWERYGEGLSLRQEEALAAVRQALAADADVPSMPTRSLQASASGAAEMDTKARTVTTKTSATASAPTDPSALHTKTEFYQWFSDMEATRASEVEAKYKNHAEAVERQIDVCNKLLGDIGSVLDIFSEIKLSQRAISGRTDALKEQCDLLVSERERLTTISGSIKERLDHFDRLEELSSLFHAPVSASSDPQRILRGLEELDSSLEFTSKHPEYLESSKYRAKFKNLQARAMSLVKSYFQESVAFAIAECKASAVLVGGAERSAGDTSNSDSHRGVDGVAGGNSDARGGDMTIQNVKFRAVAEPRLRELMAGVCSHGDREAYRQLLRDCSSAYCKARFELVRYGVLAAMQEVTAAAGAAGGGGRAPDGAPSSPPATSATTVVEILTGGSEVVSRTAEAEIQLYRHIFQGTSHAQAASMLAPLFDSMCILLAAVMEPMVYSTLANDVHGLCRINAQLVDLIRHETLGAVFDVPSLGKLVQVVEQMIIRQAKRDWKRGLVDATVTLDATLLEPSDAEFVRAATAPLDVGACRERRRPEPFEPVARGIRMMTAVQASVSGQQAIELVREIVPGLLDVVHRASEPEVCGAAAAASGLFASGQSEVDGRAHTGQSEAYGAIFALRQLCLLSQCLNSLHVSELDAELGDGVGGNAKGGDQGGKRGLVSSLSSRIPLLASLSSLASRSSQGAASLSGAGLKAMLDKKTVVAREFCILTCAQDATNPLLSFLTKVTAAKVSGREQIKSHAFATLDRVKQLSSDVRAAIEGPLVKNIALLHMVLPDPELDVVVGAIRGNLEDAQSQMQDILRAEYAPAEVEEIAFLSFDETSRMLGLGGPASK